MKRFFTFTLLVVSSLFVTSCISTAKTESTDVVEIPAKPKSVLHELAAENKTEEIQSLFQTETDIDSVDTEGNTALHIAASLNNADLVSYLLFKGAKSNDVNNEGDTPLHVAIENNAVDCVALLAPLNLGENLFTVDAEGFSALDRALDKGSLLIDAVVPRTVDFVDKNGESVVHYLVKHRSVDGIDLACKTNHSLSIKDFNGVTPLALAYSQKDYESIEIAAKLILNNAAPERGEFSFFEDAIKMRNPSLRFDEGQTPIHLSVAKGESCLVEYLLELGANANAKDSYGNTPLHAAVSRGQYETARMLIMKGADVNAQDALGNTPLLLVNPSEDQIPLYQLLLTRGAKINATTSYGDTVLHIATLKESPISVLDFLVKNGAVINERNKKGVTPLAQAVEKCIIEHINFYSQAGADIHAADIVNISPLQRALLAGFDITEQLVNSKNIDDRDSLGNTALHIAIENNAHIDQIMYILNLGVDVDARNRNGYSALYLTVQRNNRIVGEQLLTRGADVFSTGSDNTSPLQLALALGKDVQEWLLTSEVIKAQDSLGNTPLHIATTWSLNEAMLKILEKGGNPNIQNTNGESPIFIAAEKNNIEAIEILLNHGADKDLRNYLGNTILHNSVKSGSIDSALVTINNGFDINAQNLQGKTALHIAAKSNFSDMITFLLQQGADIHAADITGRTPLMDAIQVQSIENVTTLIQHGASALIPDMYGRNAYHEAIETENIELISIIATSGGNPLARDTHGRTPLSLAFKKDLVTIAAVLSDDVNLTDSDGNTPLHIAILESISEEVLYYLIDAGYSPDRRNSEGVTPLLMAAKKNNLLVVESFLQIDADPFITDNSGESALSYAFSNNQDIVNSIVQLAGDKRDIAGETILHHAARSADDETIKRLSSMGLDQSIKNISGETAYDIAIRWGRKNIATYLR